MPEQTLEELKAENARLKEEQAKAAKPADPVPVVKDPVAQGKDDYNKQTITDSEKKEIANSAKFLMGLDNFIKDHNSILPPETQTVIDAAKGGSYTDDVAKARAIKSAIARTYFEKQENINAITIPSIKDKISSYMGLTREKQIEKAEEITEALEVAISEKKAALRAEEAKKANGDFAPDNEKIKAYNEKNFFSKAKAFLTTIKG